MLAWKRTHTFSLAHVPYRARGANDELVGRRHIVQLEGEPRRESFFSKAGIIVAVTAAHESTPYSVKLASPETLSVDSICLHTSDSIS